MKPVIALLLTVLLFSCKKNDTNAPEQPEEPTKPSVFFYYNYPKLYNNGAPGDGYFALNNLIFSIDSAKHMIYGKNLSTIPIKAKLYERYDTNVVIDLPLKILSDSVAEFTMPGNLFPTTSPYIPHKYYSLVINGKPMLGDGGWLNEKPTDTGFFKVHNSRINIDTMYYVASTGTACSKLFFEGHFANTKVLSDTSSLLGVQIIPVNRQVIIRKDGVEVLSATAVERTSDVCGIAYQRYNFAFTMEYIFTYHQVVQVAVNTELEHGSYTVQVEQTLEDGTIEKTNEYPFTF